MYWFVRAAALLLAIAAAAAALNAGSVDKETRPAEARSGGTLMETGVVTANVKVEGDGPPIVLIHGFGAALDWWDEIAPELAKSHKVVRLDLIGHGGTEAPTKGYAISRQAALVKAVLSKLDIEKATVIGHSMGGEVAVAFTVANRDSVERLVLIDTPPTPERTFALGTRLAFAPLVGQALWRVRTDGVLRRALSQGFAPGFPVPDKFIADLWQLTFPAFQKSHDSSVAYTTEMELPKRLTELVPPPTLVIFGAEDELVPAKGIKRYDAVPGAKTAVIDGAGHSPMVEKPDKTLREIERFLAETNG